MHKCPIKGCPAQVPHHQLMCPAHWREVPKKLQQEVYRAYRASPLSAAHQAAMNAAIAAVNATL